jgi:hypothetical protein
MKGILITTANIDTLVSRYNIETEDKEDLLPLEYILVTDFGNDDWYDVVSPPIFDANFEWGDPIDNGFMIVNPKP